MQQLLKVHWWYGLEFIAFDEDDFSNSMTTFELWKDSTEITYAVDAKLQARGKSRKLELDYKESQQTDQILKTKPSDKIRYGTSTIIWKAGDCVGNAHWQDEVRHQGWDGDVKVSVLGGQKLEISDRAQKTVLVTARTMQAAFRDALLQLDKHCAFTGESCREVLEAAHLVPVARKGNEQIENGILLRADIYLLLDTGLIWFDISNEYATVVCSHNGLTNAYVKALAGKRLHGKTFQRVKEALLTRAELPGGRGKV